MGFKGGVFCLVFAVILLNCCYSVIGGDIVHQDNVAPSKPGCNNNFVLVISASFYSHSALVYVALFEFRESNCLIYMKALNKYLVLLLPLYQFSWCSLNFESQNNLIFTMNSDTKSLNFLK